MSESAPHGAPFGEETLDAVFAASPLPMWVCDRDTLAILHANRAAVARYGYSVEEFLRMRAADLCAEADVDVDEAASPLAGEWRHRLRNGRTIDVELTPHPVSADGRPIVLVVAHDVTHHRQTELALGRSQARAAVAERLEQSEAAYRSLIHGAAYGIFRVDADGRFLQVNPAFVAMLGYGSEGEVMALGGMQRVFADPEARNRVREEYRRAGRVKGVEVEWVRKDGSSLAVRLSGRTVPGADGALAAFEVIAEDVSERRDLEERLRKAQRMEAIGQLAGGIAHHFNNLLMTVLGYAELIAMRLPAGSEDREEVDEITKAGERAAVLTH